MQWAINHISMSNRISQCSTKPLRFQLWQQSIPSFRPFCVCRLTAGRVTSICPSTGIHLTSTKASDRCPSLTYKATKKKAKKKKKVWSVVDIQWIHLLMPSGETTVAVRLKKNYFFPSVSFFFKNQRIFYNIVFTVCLSSEGTQQREPLPFVDEDLHRHFYGYLTLNWKKNNKTPGCSNFSTNMSLYYSNRYTQ